jgi:hypothetical protein
MLRILAGAFLIAHGLVHVAIWLPRTKDAPFDVNHSPLFGDVRGPALSLAIVAAILLIVGGIGLLVQASWWPTMTIAAAGVSAVLLLVTFSPWFLIGLAINAAIIVLASRARG